MGSSLLELRKKYLTSKPRRWSAREKRQLLEDFTYHSNKIEGLQLDYGDTISFLRRGLITANSSAKDRTDLKNHHQVLQMIMESHDNLDLSVENICQLQK